MGLPVLLGFVAVGDPFNADVGEPVDGDEDFVNLGGLCKEGEVFLVILLLLLLLLLLFVVGALVSAENTSGRFRTGLDLAPLVGVVLLLPLLLLLLLGSL